MALSPSADCVKVGAPTLVVTGEPDLDRVVPTDGTREYIRAIPGAKHVLLERTGHIGLVTRPDRFADRVGDFSREDGGCFRRRRSRRSAFTGALEARLDDRRPLDRRHSRSRRPAARRGGLRAPAADARRDDAHEGRLSGREGARADRVRDAAVQLPRRRTQRRDVRRRTRRVGRLRAALDHIAALYPGTAALGRGVLVRIVGRARRRRGGSTCRLLLAQRAAARRARYDFFAHRGEHEAEVLHPGGARRDRPLDAMWASTRSCPSRRNWSSSTPRITCSTGRRRRSATRSRILLADFQPT